jgi:hypothetical protein
VDAWEFVEDCNGVKVYRRDIPGSDVIGIKGECVVPFSLAQLFTVLHNPELKMQWVDRLCNCETFDQDYEGETMRESNYIVLEMPWPLWNRDFVTQTEFVVNTETKTISMLVKGCDCAAKPPKDGLVRGTVVFANVEVSAVTDTSTRLTMDSCTDPGGVLPVMLVNMIVRSWPVNTVNKVKAVCAEKTWPVDPLLAKLMPDLASA